MRDVDLLIIGGGPAGLSTALHVHAADPKLAERMVLLEAKRYPRDKICAGAIAGRGLAALEKIGVTVDCPMVKLDAVAMRMGGETIVARSPGLGVVVRRVEFDHALAKVAIARGIEVRDGCPVATIDVQDDHVRVTTEAGEVYRAKAIVGADGVAGVVRRQTGFPQSTLRAQVVELDTEAVADDPPRDTIVFDFHTRDLHGYAWDFPTVVGGRELMCRGVYVIHSLAHDPPRPRIAQYLASRGLELSRYKLKQYAERGFEPGSEIAKRRVLLVGEAAGIDIATGEGISQSLEYGRCAGPFLAKAFERDDFRFSTWTSHIAGRHVGWQLRVRHAGYRLFYGDRRETIERMMPRMPELFRIGVRDFAGLPLSKLSLVRGAGQFLAAFAREKMRPEAGA